MNADPLSRSQLAIVAAFAELIEEVGNDDISFRLIARRAGMGERTVFRHFPTREHLLLATADWIERTVFPRESIASVFDLPLSVRETMAAYDARPELSHVVAEAAMRGSDDPRPLPRSEQLEQLLRAEAPGLTEERARGMAAALTHIDSATNWAALRREFALTGRDLADAAAWAAETVLDEIRHPAS